MEIKKFIQIGDSHFNSDKEESIFALQNAIEIIKRLNVDIIIHTGDGLDLKTRLKPEDIVNYRNEILKLNKKIFHLCGNHDRGIYQISNLEAVLSIKHPLIEIITEEKIIEFDNIIFYFIPYPDNTINKAYFVTMVNRHLDEFYEKYKNDNRLKVLILHWIIKGGISDSEDYVFLNEWDNVLSEIIGFDYILAGHLHKSQHFKNVYYSGSTYPLVHYRKPFKPTLILWEVKDREMIPHFIEIPVLFQKLIIEINDEKDLKKLQTSAFSKNDRIKIISHIRLTPTQIEELKNQNIEVETKIEEKEIKLERTKFTFAEILKELNITENANELIKFHEEIKNELIKKEKIMSRKGYFKPLQIQAVNYKQFDRIDFDFRKTGKVIAVIGENASGKTNFIDSIFYALYRCSSKGEKIEEIIKKGRAYCKLQLIFQRDNDIYRITRNLGAVNENILEKKVNGEFLLITKDFKEIQKIINRLCGTYEITKLSIYSTQDEITNFLNLRPAEKMDKLLQFLEISEWQLYHEFAKDKLNKIEAEFNELMGRVSQLEETIKPFNENQMKKEISTLNKKLINLEKEIAEIRKEKELTNKKLGEIETLIKKEKELTRKINDCEKYLSQLPSVILTEKELEEKLNEIKNNLKEKKNQFNSLEINLRRLENKLHQIEKSLTFSNAQYSQFKKDEEILEKINCNRDDCLLLNEVKERVNKLYEIKKNIDNLSTAKEELKFQIAEYQNKKELLEKEIIEIEQAQEKYSNDLKLINEKEKISILYENYKKELSQIRIDKREDPVELKEKLNKLTNAETHITYEYQKTTKRINELESQLNLLQIWKKELTEKKEKVKKLEQKIMIFKQYVDLTHRNKIPSWIIERFIPELESIANNILQRFGIQLQIQKTEKEIDINYTDKSGHLFNIVSCSGFQRTIIGIAIRLALVILKQLFGYPSYIFILDEGFGTADAENRELMKQLLREIPNQLNIEKLIFVSHIEDLREVSDTTIVIKDGKIF